MFGPDELFRPGRRLPGRPLNVTVSGGGGGVPAVVENNSLLWLDADDADTITLGTGSNLSVWADKSGNGNDATADPSRTPQNGATVNGRNAIAFTQDSVTYPPIQGYGKSWFAVVRDTSLSGVDIYVGDLANRQLRSNAGDLSIASVVFPWAGSSSGLTISSGVNLMQWDLTDPLAMRLNGVLGTTYALTGTASFELDTLGNNGFGQYATADYCEVICLDHIATSAERGAINAYLAEKWGVTLA